MDPSDLDVQYVKCLHGSLKIRYNTYLCIIFSSNSRSIFCCTKWTSKSDRASIKKVLFFLFFLSLLVSNYEYISGEVGNVIFLLLYGFLWLKIAIEANCCWSLPVNQPSKVSVSIQFDLFIHYFYFKVKVASSHHHRSCSFCPLFYPHTVGSRHKCCMEGIYK